LSEYQYYEFQAVGHALDEQAMSDLRAITSRARITSTSLVNVYHFGDFKGDTHRLLDRYFDAFLYVANWGTRRLMFKFPRSIFDETTVKQYCALDALRSRITTQNIILEFCSDNEEGDDFEEGDGWLGSLITLWSDLLAGDMRSLYLAWLAGVQSQHAEDFEDAKEPLVPPGLKNLSAPLQRLADFLRLDLDLVEVASQASSGIDSSSLSPQKLADWVARLPEHVKSRCIVRLMQGETSSVAHELRKQFREDEVRPPKEQKRRTIQDLLTSRDQLASDKQKEAEKRSAKEREQRSREEEFRRTRYLESLLGREKQLWQKVESSASMRQPKGYDHAVALLKDLCDLSKRSKATADFESHLAKFRRRHGGKSSLIRRLDEAGLSQ